MGTRQQSRFTRPVLRPTHSCQFTFWRDLEGSPDCMGYYDIGQVCLNGHAITGHAGRSPEFRENFCTKCGAATITECPRCKTSIRGKFESEGVVAIGFPYEPPAHCHQCGAAYPW